MGSWVEESNFPSHTPDLIIFSHTPAHPQSNHQPAHRLLIHLTVNCLQSTLPILFYISPLWHDGREFTDWNKKVNLSTNSFLPPPLKIKKLQSPYHTLRELCHSTDLILDTFPKLALLKSSPALKPQSLEFQLRVDLRCTIIAAGNQASQRKEWCLGVFVRDYLCTTPD